MCTQHYDWFEGGSGIRWFTVAIETIAVECRRQQGCRWPHTYAGVGVLFGESLHSHVQRREGPPNQLILVRAGNNCWTAKQDNRVAGSTYARCRNGCGAVCVACSSNRAAKKTIVNKYVSSLDSLTRIKHRTQSASRCAKKEGVALFGVRG